MTVTVGTTDKRGSLLILGGHKVNLWRLANGLFAVGGNTLLDPKTAVSVYNEYNETDLREDYITEVFEPWYREQFKVVAEVPSSRDPNKKYLVKQGPDGSLTCECPGYYFRRECWHTQAVKELSSGRLEVDN